MEFKKYQHIENDFNSKEVIGLLSGIVHIQPKLDGSNCQIYLENGELVITSRNKVLTADSDNANCYKTLIKKPEFMELLIKYPHIKLCGEWLIPHTVKYKNDAYNKFYLFDIYDMVRDEYVSIIHYVQQDDHINTVPTLMINAEEFIKDYIGFFENEKYASFVNYLIDDGTSNSEGIVVKNFNYKNPFGHQKWCKLINHKYFKQKGQKSIKQKSLIDTSPIENALATIELDHLFAKCHAKLNIDKNFNTSKYSEYIKMCQVELFEDYGSILDNLDRRNLCNSIAKKAINYVRNIKNETVEIVS